MMTVEYNNEIEQQILSHLDGWVASTEPINDDTEPLDTEPTDDDIQPFINDIGSYVDNPNKRVKSGEIEGFYKLALKKAYVHCNRLNVDDLSSIEEEVFIKGVCLLTASDLWNKYNIRVNNEDMEDTYIQSYGGLLYKQAMNILNSFINQRVATFTTLKKKHKKNDNIWII